MVVGPLGAKARRWGVGDNRHARGEPVKTSMKSAILCVQGVTADVVLNRGLAGMQLDGQ
jgi:hypothetical protein